MKSEYTAKTLFTGYKIGLKSPSLYVGVPTKYFNHIIRVNFKDKSKVFGSGQIKAKKVFNDRFRPKVTYELAYFLWERKKKADLRG